ncbi:MAG: hypothetical protein RL490_247 [Pseudomonadota bacterium]|jgi:flagellar biosynthetic protein FlhB
MADSDAEKTETATPRKRRQALEQGNVWQPRELGAAAAVLCAAGLFGVMGGELWQGLAGYLALVLADAAPAADDSLPVLALALRAPLLVPLLLALAVLVVTLGLGQAATRHVSLQLLAPKFPRLNPAAGLGRLFSLAGLAGGATALLKLAAVAALALVVVPPLIPQLAHVGDDGGALALIGAAVLRLASAGALLLLAIAVVDGGISWWLREKKLRMSRDEVRRESRENDGAPEVKAAIKKAQFAAASRRLRGTMAEAAVVVVNPVHFAVAMRYRPGQDSAPIVIEKGEADMARAIIAVARELKVPVLRTPRLARALYFTARRGGVVREELFTAVATILAFVMRFDAMAEDDAPPVFVPPDFDFDEQGQRRKAGAPLPL